MLDMTTQPQLNGILRNPCEACDEKYFGKIECNCSGS